MENEQPKKKLFKFKNPKLDPNRRDPKLDSNS